MLFHKRFSIKTGLSIVLLLLLTSSCFGSFIENDDILLKKKEVKTIHKDMAFIVRNHYMNLPESASDMINNLCTAFIQYAYEYEGKILITKSYPVLKNDKIIIASSSYTQDLYKVNSKEDLEILSWPCMKDGRLRSKLDKSNTKFDKKSKLTEPTDIYLKLFGKLENHNANKHIRCCKALGISETDYNGLLNNKNPINNPIIYLKTNYKNDYEPLDFETFKHAEPLLVKWIEENLKNLQAQHLKGFLEEGKIEENKLKILYPIIHFHTRRQTCPHCENLIQKSAKKFKYVPIISFSKIYFADNKEISEKKISYSIPCKSSLNLDGKGEEISHILPFSTFKNDFLDARMLTQLALYQKPRSKRFYLKKMYQVKEIEKVVKSGLMNEEAIKKLDINNFLRMNLLLKGIKRFPFQFFQTFSSSKIEIENEDMTENYEGMD